MQLCIFAYMKCEPLQYFVKLAVLLGTSIKKTINGWLILFVGKAIQNANRRKGEKKVELYQSLIRPC